jgi:hypothetical protein
VHRFRSIVAVALLVVTEMALISLGPAAAGGPTSVLLSVPGQGRTASLYYTDPEYVALAGLVGIERNGFGTVDRSGVSHENGPGVTVTWLIHDVTPWRVDHIYLEGLGAPWIATQIVGESETNGNSDVVWHQPVEGNLAALLDELGVGAAARDAGTFTGVAGAPTPTPAEPTAQESQVAGRSATADGVASVAWGVVGGLIVGVLVTALWMRRRNKPAQAGLPAAGQEGPGLSGVVVRDELFGPAPRA